MWAFSLSSNLSQHRVREDIIFTQVLIFPQQNTSKKCGDSPRESLDPGALDGFQLHMESVDGLLDTKPRRTERSQTEGNGLPTF